MEAVRHRIVELALESLDLPLADPIVAAGVRAIAEGYIECRESTLTLFPDSLDSLGKLQARGIPLALLTNGEGKAQREKINRFDLARWFDPVLIEGECGYGKPDPRIFQDALGALQVAPEACWMVGDNWNGRWKGPRRWASKASG